MKLETPQAIVAATAAPVHEMNPRTRMLLQAPIASTLVKLAWPNLLVMLAQASTECPLCASHFTQLVIDKT